MENTTPLLVSFFSFALVALAARPIGLGFVRLGLPQITGYLATGLLAGPFVLDLIPTPAIAHLRVVDEIALSFIAFAAGSELYLKELQSRLNSIKWITFGLVVSAFVLGSLAVYLLADRIAFMQAMPATHRLAVAILAGAILVARSPSSAIAVVNELRAKGPFTRTVLGVTVIMDVLVIALFAVNTSLADALLTGLGIEIRFAVVLVVELTASLVVGILLGRLILLILAWPLSRVSKTVLLLGSGYTTFAFSALVRHASHDWLHAEILLEPLLICMIASFLAVNRGHCRAELSAIFQAAGLPVYVAFFTLTGASLALDILAAAWPIALVLIVVRLGAIFIGTFAGGVLAGDPMRFNRIGWMAFITQAGVGLGLAKEVVVQFPGWGAAFATIMIAVIVANQIIGPPFFKWAIRLAGEARTRAEAPTDRQGRTALIFGIEAQSLALAGQLQRHGWQVAIATRKKGYARQAADTTTVPIRLLAGLNHEGLDAVSAERADTIVAMLSDEDNFRICELAYEHYGTENLIVRLTDTSDVGRFSQLGALVVEPATAMVSVLDQFVRSPSAATLLLGMEAHHQVLEVPVRNPDLQGIALRDLRLPLDIQIVSLRRRGQMLIQHGFTRLEVGDAVTLVGAPDSLAQVSLRLDTNRRAEALHLVERVRPAELSDAALPDHVRAAFEPPDDLSAQRLDRLFQKCAVLDVKQALGLDAFFEMASEALAGRLDTTPQAICRQLKTREQQSGTAVSAAIAIPHIIVDGENSFAITLVRCRRGIAFSRAAPAVTTVFVLAGSRDLRRLHLHVLSRIARMVQDPRFEKRWLKAANEADLRQLVRQGIKNA